MALRLAVGVVSGAALAHQLLLMRLFSIVQWHHFAYMVISLALLGYGASGALLTVARRSLLARFESAFPWLAALFGLTAPASFAAAQALELNPLELAWDPRQLALLGAVYVVLAVPFACAGGAVGLALMRADDAAVGRLYRADLVGAACGAVAALAALYRLEPAACLRLVAGAGAVAAAAAALGVARAGSRRRLLAAPAAALAAAALLPGTWLAPRMSQYKALSKALAVPGAEVVAERSSPQAALAAVRSPRIPFRFAPGLSLAYRGELPEQIVVFADGEVASVVDRAGAAGGLSGHLDYLPGAVPSRLAAAVTGGGPRVALLEGGAGAVAQALFHGASTIDAVAGNPQLPGLVDGELGDFSGRPYDHPRLALHALDPRGFLTSTAGRRWDLVRLEVESVAAGAAASALDESHVLTVEAFGLLIAALEEAGGGGLLVVEGELATPPRASLKVVATAAAALERAGLEASTRLAALRSWDRYAVVVKRRPWTAAEIESLEELSSRRFFDLAYYPGMAETEANRFHVLEQAPLYRGIRALLGPGQERFVRDYKFHLEPATDDRPYFYRFFRWRSLPELLRLRQRGGAAFLEWGYLLPVATLAQAALAGLVLILAPLGKLAGRRRAAPVGLYFLCLGLGFLFLEIAYIQGLTLFLGHPLRAAAVTLAGFLLFAGLGSGASRRLAADSPAAIARAIVAVVLVALAELALLPPLFARGAGWPLAVKLPVALAAIAPLAFALGMPFPLGLRRLAGARPDLVPWAWGVNGWASVLAAVAATLLAVHLGFRAVLLAACALYLLAALAARALGGPAEGDA